MKRLIYLLLLFIPFLNYGQTNSFDVTKGTIRSHLRMVPNASPPSNVLIGTLYFDTDTNYYWFDGVQWQQFGGGDSYWQLRGSSEDTITAGYNVYLDSAFLMNYRGDGSDPGWYFGYNTWYDLYDDNVDTVLTVGYYDSTGVGKRCYIALGTFSEAGEKRIMLRNTYHGGNSTIDMPGNGISLSSGIGNDGAYIAIIGDTTVIKNYNADGAQSESYIRLSPTTGVDIVVDDTAWIDGYRNKLLIKPDSTVFGTENIYMPDITSDGGKFEYLVGLDPNGRLFPQPLASAYDNIIERAIDSGYYGKENIKDVGSVSEIYSDFSTAVAAASAGDVIELSNATFTETGTVTMPTGSTLKIYEGGLLSGTFTLVGDNTRLDAGLYQCFGSGVTITGTWIVDKTYVDWFGMVGAADEGGELTAAINFCKLTTGKTLVFQSRTYYVENFITYWAGGGTIEGNNAVIKITYNSATEYEEALRIYGSVGTYDTLAVDAVFGSYILDVPAGSALLSLNRGDMVKIISDASPDGTTNLHGEIKIVDTVIAAGRNVKFTEPLYSTYYAADNARMAELTMGKAVIKDLTIIGLPGRNYNLGIELKYIDKPIIENVKLENFKYSAFGLQDCYAGRFDVVANNAMGSTGLGYGVVLYGASMNNVVTIRGFSMRHITATGGNGSQGGIPYNNLFVDCIGTGVYAHAYDLHKACGTGNKYVNCRASAGVAIGDTANFQGQWSAVVTYDNNDIVSIAKSKSQSIQLYKSTTNGNLNNSPITDLGTNWEVYNNALYGFYIGNADVTIENCQTEGFYAGFAFVNTTHRNIRVDGLKVINSRYAILFGTDTISNSSFNNIQLQNETFKDDAFALYFSNSILNKVSFSNISAKGAFGVFLSGTTFSDKKLEINTLVADGIAEISTQTPELHFNISTAFITQQTSPGYILSTATTSNGLKSINVGNLTVQGAAARPIVINSHLTSLSFGNVILTDGSTTAFIDNTDSIDAIDIGYIHNDGSGAIYYCENTGGVIGTLNVKNSTGNINNAPFNSGNYPTTINTNRLGFIDAIDFRTPAAAMIGMIKQGGHFLLNTYRTGNLGLGYDAVTNRGVLDYNSGTTYNTGIGYQTLWDLDPSAAPVGNTAVGSTALYAITIGDDNTGIGRKAGELITTGVQNTIIGSGAAQLLPGGSDRNVIIGYNAWAAVNTEQDDRFIVANNSTTTLLDGDFTTGRLRIEKVLQVTPTTDPPGTPVSGDIRYDSDDNHFYGYTGSGWVRLDYNP